MVEGRKLAAYDGRGSAAKHTEQNPRPPCWRRVGALLSVHGLVRTISPTAHQAMSREKDIDREGEIMLRINWDSPGVEKFFMYMAVAILIVIAVGVSKYGGELDSSMPGL